MKTCNMCLEAKPLDDFYKHPQGSLGRQSRCKPCASSAQRERLKKLTDEQWHARTIRKFGITPDEYAEMLESQDGACAICRRPERRPDRRTGRPRRLAVDHDHKTNEVRGLLCSDCNVALGLLEDDEERVFAALSYLKKVR